MEKKEFVNLISKVTTQFGFTKRGTRFIKKTPDLTFVLDLQKSSWSNGYYINGGIFINILIIDQNTNILKSQYGDIRLRLGNGTPVTLEGGAIGCSQLFELDCPACTEDMVTEQLTSSLNESVLPVSSIDDIRQIVEAAKGTNCFKDYIITSTAINFFGKSVLNKSVTE